MMEKKLLEKRKRGKKEPEYVIKACRDVSDHHRQLQSFKLAYLCFPREEVPTEEMDPDAKRAITYQVTSLKLALHSSIRPCRGNFSWHSPYTARAV